MMNNLFKFFFIFLILSCNADKKRIVVEDNLIAEGIINDDTIYNGLIKFYTKENLLVSECNYLNGALNGERINFFPNGKVSVRLFYENGKRNGYSSYFNEDGSLRKEEFFYYDINSGHATNYRSGKVASYWFYSLDKDVLFDINYDSILNRKITDLKSDYFFYKRNEYGDVEDKVPTKKEELFIYTPNPPGYNFRYSLVQIDSSFNVKVDLIDFDPQKCWGTMPIPFLDTDKNIKNAIRLKIHDPNDKDDLVMFKILY